MNTNMHLHNFRDGELECSFDHLVYGCNHCFSKVLTAAEILVFLPDKIE